MGEGGEGGALLWKTLVGGGYMGECCFLVLEGDHPRFSSLHPSQGKFACN